MRGSMFSKKKLTENFSLWRFPGSVHLSFW
jgi:hypothetical protein